MMIGIIIETHVGAPLDQYHPHPRNNYDDWNIIKTHVGASLDEDLGNLLPTTGHRVVQRC